MDRPVPARRTRVERHGERRLRRRRRQLLLLLTLGLALLSTVGVLALRGGSEEPVAAPATSLPGPADVRGPYDFEERTVELTPASLANSKFISVSLSGEDGVIAYSLGPEKPEFAALARLLPGRHTEFAHSIEAEVTVTFVSSDRSTVTFELDLGKRLCARGNAVWEIAPEVDEVIEGLARSRS